MYESLPLHHPITGSCSVLKREACHLIYVLLDNQPTTWAVAILMTPQAGIKGGWVAPYEGTTIGCRRR